MTRAKKRNCLFGLKYIDAGSENTKKIFMVFRPISFIAFLTFYCSSEFVMITS